MKQFAGMREIHCSGAGREAVLKIQAKQIHRILSGEESDLFPAATLLRQLARRQWRRQNLRARRRPRSDHTGLLPNNYSHAEQVKRFDFNIACCRYLLQHPPDFLHSVSPAH